MALSFDNATLVGSNLGGIGGQGAPDALTPPVIRYHNVGRRADGAVIDLEVRNLTAYRAFAARNNGLKAQDAGSFGVINLKAADVAGSSSFVELRFSFLDATTDAPVTLPRTHVTFYDFDNSKFGIRECMQVNGGVLEQAITDSTELEQFEMARVE